MVADVLGAPGRIDGLVNNAGGQYPHPARDIALKGWETVVRNNLTGGFLVRSRGLHAVGGSARRRRIATCADSSASKRGRPGKVFTARRQSDRASHLAAMSSPIVAPVPALQALSALWSAVAMDPQALGRVDLQGREPVLPSSFAVGTAAQVSLAAAALAAAEIGWVRHGVHQRVAVDMLHAALECRAWFSLNGRAPEMWDKLSGLYPCGSAPGAPGWVRIHANFAHHRDGALKLLGCATGAATERAAVADALRYWRAEDFEAAAAQAGLVVAAARDFAAWDAHPQARAISALPTVSIARIDGVGADAAAGDAANPGRATPTSPTTASAAPPLPWPSASRDAPPLHGLRVLDLTRILAGPVAGRTLAAYGADVMLVNSPNLPNIESIADTSRGKWSAHVDLTTESGREALRALISTSHVFMQGYRPGGLAALGFGPADVARLRPGIVCVSLSAYGPVGPWAGRRGFDSLVQTATGFNHAEAQAHGAREPRAMPMQILDYAAGYLLAFGAQVALLRQAQQGGSWHVQVSLAGVGHWLRRLGRVPAEPAPRAALHDAFLESYPGGFGEVTALRHAARFSQTPAHWRRPAMPPGSHPPVWPQDIAKP
jgi:CoA-transferase family III